MQISDLLYVRALISSFVAAPFTNVFHNHQSHVLHKRKLFSSLRRYMLEEKWVKSSIIENETENFLLSH